MAMMNSQRSKRTNILTPHKKSQKIKLIDQVLVQAGAPINQRADGTFFHPKYKKYYDFDFGDLF